MLPRVVLPCVLSTSNEPPRRNTISGVGRRERAFRLERLLVAFPPVAVEMHACVADGLGQRPVQRQPVEQRLQERGRDARGAGDADGKLTWGKETRSYTAEELQDGINLAAEFANNPFVEAFTAVDEAVAKKQAYETKQIKQEFHGAAGKADMEGTVRRTEAERAPLAAAIQSAFKPVTHTLRLQPE